MNKNRFWSVAFLFLFAGQMTQAKINPEAFRQGNPECVIIRVIASHVEAESAELTQVYLAAEVIDVFETSSDLKAGDHILIIYDQDHAGLQRQRASMRELMKTGWGGPQVLYYPGILATGDVRIAHLAPHANEKSSSGRVYKPNAHQYSFEPESAREKYQQ